MKLRKSNFVCYFLGCDYYESFVKSNIVIGHYSRLTITMVPNFVLLTFRLCIGYPPSEQHYMVSHQSAHRFHHNL
jgi:hypothetical protein